MSRIGIGMAFRFVDATQTAAGEHVSKCQCSWLAQVRHNLWMLGSLCCLGKVLPLLDWYAAVVGNMWAWC